MVRTVQPETYSTFVRWKGLSKAFSAFRNKLDTDWKKNEMLDRTHPFQVWNPNFGIQKADDLESLLGRGQIAETLKLNDYHI